jgi:ribosomal-protein-serine acetyltransferase
MQQKARPGWYSRQGTHRGALQLVPKHARRRRELHASPAIALVAPVLEDALDIAEAVRESILELDPWMPWATADYSSADASSWITSCAEALPLGAAFEFVIRAADGALLGSCGLNHIDQDNRRANLGYWVRTTQAGQGIAAAAVRLLVAWTFGHTDLERLEIMPSVRNLRSQRVAEAVGARREGVQRNRLLLHGTFHSAVMYSIVRADWIHA